MGEFWLIFSEKSILPWQSVARLTDRVPRCPCGPQHHRTITLLAAGLEIHRSSIGGGARRGLGAGARARGLNLVVAGLPFRRFRLPPPRAHHPPRPLARPPPLGAQLPSPFADRAAMACCQDISILAGRASPRRLGRRPHLLECPLPRRSSAGRSTSSSPVARRRRCCRWPSPPSATWARSPSATTTRSTPRDPSTGTATGSSSARAPGSWSSSRRSMRWRAGRRIQAELVGAALTADAFHISAPEPTGRGATMAMTKAMADAGVAPDEIDYIVAHGTSTPLNDVTETRAIKAAFGGHAHKVADQLAEVDGRAHARRGRGASARSTASAPSARASSRRPINLENPDLPECDLDYVPLVARKATRRHGDDQRLRLRRPERGRRVPALRGVDAPSGR